MRNVRMATFDPVVPTRHASVTAMNGGPLQSDIDREFAKITMRLDMLGTAAAGSDLLSDHDR